MSQFDLELPDIDGLAGSELRSARIFNESLDEVRAQGDPFCTYMAEVRWLVLQLSHYELAEAAGIDYTAVKSLETTGSVPQNVTLHRMYTHLKAIEPRYRPHELSSGFLDVAVRERYGTSKRMHAPESDIAYAADERSPLSVTQVYYRWAIMKTLAAVEEASGIQSGGIWQCEATGILPDFVEMARMHKKLKLEKPELDLARTSWTRDRGIQLLGRDIPPALADFLTRIEAHGLPSFTAESIRSAIGCTYDHAGALHSGHMVPFDAIATVAGKLYGQDELMDFAESWETQHADDKELPRFGPSFVRIRDQIGVTNRQLAIAMDIRAPENRGPATKKKKKVERSETFRPSSAIRVTLEDVGNSPLAPAGVLVGLLSHAASLKDGEIIDPADELRETFNDHRSRSLKRSGASIHSSSLRLARDYWGIDRAELATALDLSEDVIEALEKSDDVLPHRVATALEKLGEAKLKPAQKRWTELIEPPEPTTVQNLFINLQRKAGSFEALEALLCANKHESKRGASGPALAGMANGSIVPPWPMIQRFCSQSGMLEFPSEEARPAEGQEHNTHELLWRDWCVKYADSLHAKGKTAIVARSLHHLYGQHAESLRDFIPNMSVSYPTQTRVMQRLEAEEWVDWTQIGRTLDAAGLELESAQYVFIRTLHETVSIEAAIAATKKAVRDDDVFEYESYRFGLTTKERKKFKLQE